MCFKNVIIGKIIICIKYEQKIIYLMQILEKKIKILSCPSCHLQMYDTELHIDHFVLSTELRASRHGVTGGNMCQVP